MLIKVKTVLKSLPILPVAFRFFVRRARNWLAKRDLLYRMKLLQAQTDKLPKLGNEEVVRLVLSGKDPDVLSEIAQSRLTFIRDQMLERVGEPDRAPNVVIILADDLGWDEVGCLNKQVKETPSLDEMASSGVLFDRFYSASPICSPTRASVLTGRVPARSRMTMSSVLPEEEITLPQCLRALGYRTAHFGKWHIGFFEDPPYTFASLGAPREALHHLKDRMTSARYTPGKAGYEQWLSVDIAQHKNEYGIWRFSELDYVEQANGKFIKTPGHDGFVDDHFTDAASAFMEDCVKEKKPFMAMLSLRMPHVFFYEDRVTMGYSGGEKVSLPEKYRCLSSSQLYPEVVKAIDDQVKRIRDKLRELRVEDDTLLWFMSDNGPEYQLWGRENHNALAGGKFAHYDNGTRVPSIVEWPSGASAGLTLSDLSSTCDVLPTILEAVGYRLQGRNVDGESLRFFKGDVPAEIRKPLVIFDDHEQKWANVLDGNDKLTLFFESEGGYFPRHSEDAAQIKLFDMSQDPKEENDLLAERPDRVSAIREIYDAAVSSILDSRRGLDY